MITCMQHVSCAYRTSGKCFEGKYPRSITRLSKSIKKELGKYCTYNRLLEPTKRFELCGLPILHARYYFIYKHLMLVLTEA